MTNDATVPLIARMVLRELEPARLWRIVIVEAPNLTWLSPLDEREWPHARTIDTLVDQMRKQQVILEPDDPFRMRVLAPSNPKTDLRDQRRWERIRDLVTDKNLSRLMRPDHRRKLMLAHTVEKQVSWKVLAELLRRYWARGMTPAAVGVDYAACGAPGRRRTLTDRRPGPTGTIVGADGKPTPVTPFIVTPAVRERFEVGSYLHLNRDFTRKLAYEHLIAQYWPDRDAVIPTFRQFDYYIYTHHSATRRRRCKLGVVSFNLGARALPGRVDDWVDGPGARFEIDATIGDVHLVAQHAPTLLVGRPTIYYVVDTWSRLIVGLHVTLEAPSWIGAVSALVNAVTPKVEFCARYGCEIEEWEWPSKHLPASLLGDRGEMMSIRNGSALIEKLGVDVQNTPPGRGDLKPTVERDFHHVAKTFKALIPGWIKPDFRRRGERDYREGAVLTLRDYTAIQIEAVLEHNRTPTTAHAVTPGMVADGLTGSPIHFWDWGIRNRTGQLAMWDVDIVALHLLPTEQARLTVHGVEWRGGRYNCQEFGSLEFLEEARVRSVPLEISFDPRNVDTIYMRDRRLQRGYARLELEAGSVNAGMSLAEVRKFTAQARLLARTEARELLRRNIASNGRVNGIVAAAKARVEAERAGASVTAKDLKGIRENRASEQTFTKREQAIELGLPVPEVVPALPDPGFAPSPVTAPVPMLPVPRRETPAERLRRLRLERESNHG